eukprot:UN01611
MSESTGRRYKRYKDPMDAPYRPDKIKIPAKPKQNGAPKRPMSAYFLFAGDQRQAVKDANPELSLTEIAKILGADWGKVSKREKKKYLDEAAEKLGDYKEKRAEYEASSKYKLWKKKTAEWNDLYKEDWDEQQF